MSEHRCSYMCVMSLTGTQGPASVKYFRCPYGEDEEYCSKHGNFERLRQEYQDAGDDPAAALWKAHAMLDIPTAYTITGNVRGWEEKYLPEKYKETVKREMDFLKSVGKIKEPEPEPERQQMTIEEIIRELHNDID